MNNGIYAKFNTSRGTIVVNLEFEKTPGTVGNCIALAEGNLETMKNMHPALRSRIRGSGYEVYMKSVLEDTPENVERTIQVQIQTASASVLEITLDGTNFVAINNQVALSGLGTFTMLVAKDTLLNFRNSDVPGLVVAIVVAA